MILDRCPIECSGCSTKSGCSSCTNNNILNNNVCITQCNPLIFYQNPSICNNNLPPPIIPQIACNFSISITNKITQFILDGSSFEIDTLLANCTYQYNYLIVWVTQLSSFSLINNNQSFIVPNVSLIPSLSPLFTNVSLFVNNILVSQDNVSVTFNTVNHQ